MSNHERVYEGTLNWPLAVGPVLCAAPAGEGLPPWGLSDEDPLPENPCGAVIEPEEPTLAGLRDAIEEHMRKAHGEQV